MLLVDLPLSLPMKIFMNKSRFFTDGYSFIMCKINNIIHTNLGQRFIRYAFFFFPNKFIPILRYNIVSEQVFFFLKSSYLYLIRIRNPVYKKNWKCIKKKISCFCSYIAPNCFRITRNAAAVSQGRTISSIPRRNTYRFERIVLRICLNSRNIFKLKINTPETRVSFNVY